MLAIAESLRQIPSCCCLDAPDRGTGDDHGAGMLAALGRTAREEGLAARIVEQHAQKILPITDRALISSAEGVHAQCPAPQ